MDVEYVGQQEMRDMLADFMVKNPMSWNQFAKRVGISINTVRKFKAGRDLVHARPIFKILRFIRGDNNEQK